MVVAKKIGSGAYGNVCLVRRNDKEMAIKRNFVDPNISFIGSLRELDLVSRCVGHPNIVQLLEIIDSETFDATLPKVKDKKIKIDTIYLGFEQAIGDLRTYITRNNPHYCVRKSFVSNLMLGMDFLHQQKIMHRDIKPENLLVFENAEHCVFLKICDFGLSKPISHHEPISPHIITPWYRSPEICLELPNHGFPADVWSVGCVLVEMMTGRALLENSSYSSCKDSLMLKSILSTIPGICPTKVEEMYHPSPYKVPDYKPTTETWESYLKITSSFDQSAGSRQEFYQVIEQSLQFDPTQRKSISELLELPYFTSLRPVVEKQRRIYEFTPNHLVKLGNPVIRSLIGQLVMMYYEARKYHSWYCDRIIFQAIDICDRFHESFPHITDLTEISLVFRVALYIAIKYFATFGTSKNFFSLIPVEHRTPALYKQCQEYETMFVKHYRGLVYRPTIYEVLPEIHDVRSVLQKYLSLHSVSIPLQDLANQILRI